MPQEPRRGPGMPSPSAAGTARTPEIIAIVTVGVGVIVGAVAM